MEAGAPVFDDLGTRKLFEVLILEVFRNSEAVPLGHVETYCFSRVMRSGRALPNALRLLEWLGFLIRDQDNLVPTPQLDAIREGLTAEGIPLALVRSILGRLRDSGHFTEVFATGCITRAPESRALYIATSKIPHKHLSLIVLFRNFDLLTERVEGTGLLEVDHSVTRLLADTAATSPHKHKSRTLTLEALKLIHAAQEAQGLKAEEYVVALERRRLSAHPHLDLVRSISSEDAGAGFDVVSFQSDLSPMHDRFIEVKSYKDRCCFYWSRNERDTAHELGDAYYLYLVDINQVEDTGYVPIVIKNPAENLSDGWVLESESWLVSPKVVPDDRRAVPPSN